MTIGLANSSDVLIRCCDGSLSERESAQKVLDDHVPLVLDITVIGTLILLDRVALLRTIPRKLIIASSTMAILEKMLTDEESSDKHSVGVLTEADGRPRFIETTEEVKRQRLKDLRELLQTIRDRCEVQICQQMAYFPPDKRKDLVELFGQHGAESVVLASESGYALWTDDLTLAACGKEIAGIGRVWTHLVLQDLGNQKVLDEAKYLLLTAKLAGWGYFFTSINPAVVVAAGRLAKWNPDKWPLKQCLRYLHNETVSLADAVNLARDLIVRIHREDLLPESKNSAIVGILEHLAKRNRGQEGILVMKRTLPSSFGLDVFGANDANKTIDAWFAAKRR